jgi:TonB family protein
VPSKQQKTTGMANSDSFWADIGIQITMMTAAVNTPTKAESFDPCVKKIQSICDTHNVPFGSPEDLSSFVQKLAEDRHFAMDFWALDPRLNSMGVRLSDKRLLALVVDSVTGRDVQYARDVSKKLVDDLSRMLAEVEPDGPMGLSDVKAAALPPGTESQGFADYAKRATGKEPPATGPTPHPLEEALSRLERENLLLNERLNDLDNKVSKIEPHGEEITSTGSSASSPAAKEEVREPVEEPVLRPLGSSRSVTEPRRASFAHREEDDPSIPIPLAGYSQGGGHGRIALVAVLLLAIVGGLFAEQRYGSSSWQRYSVALRERYSSLMDKMHGAGFGQIAVNSTNKSAPQSAAAGSAPESASKSASGSTIPSDSSSSNPPLPPDASASSAPVAGSSSASEQKMTEQAAAPDRSRASDSEFSPRSRRKAMSSDAVTVAPVAKAALSDVDDADAIKVAPDVMEANLVSSRVPAYPEAAKVDRIEGSVVMRAVISKGGTVTRVEVLEGPRRLRNSASEAARTWRYRPYLLNGRPVDVATTITVDFSLGEH